jgi:hypothetical protein
LLVLPGAEEWYWYFLLMVSCLRLRCCSDMAAVLFV